MFVSVRLPLYLNADFLIWSDEAANLLTIKHLLQFKEPYFFYHGMRYQGLTEGLLALPAVALFGFTALSLKIAGTIVYLLFAGLALCFLFRKVTNRSLRILACIFAVIPTTHLYYCSFMAYGGHLLNAFLGFALFVTIYRFHERRATNSWAYPITVSLIIALGLYTYRQYLVFYPSLLLFFMTFRGGLPLLSRKNIRNAIVIFAVAALLPSLVQKIGYAIQNSTYENVNSFISFDSFVFNGIPGVRKQLAFVSGQLLPTLFFTSIQERFQLLGYFSLSLATLALGITTYRTRRDHSDISWLFRFSVIHTLVIFTSVLITPYAIIPMDVRYLMPIYAVLPFIFTAWFHYSQQSTSYFLSPKVIAFFGYVVVLLFSVNTVAFNTYTGISKGVLVQRMSTPYQELLGYLRSQNLNCIYMDYPDAYRVSLISGENIRASATHFPRIRRYEECAQEQNPRTLVLRNSSEELPMFLDFRVKDALKFKVRKRLAEFTVLQSISQSRLLQ